MSKAKHIVIIAGEESGDLLGGRLMAALKSQSKKTDIKFSGIGGFRMKEEGLEPLFSMEDLSVMGLFEVLPRLRLLMRRIKQTVSHVQTQRPDAVITIDAPDFSFRVQKKIKESVIDNNHKPKQIHYVAPSVWAWRPGRAKKIARFLDLLLCLLPFEPPYFEKEGLDAKFIGHSIVQSDFCKTDAEEFRKTYGLTKAGKILIVLPGSRMSEIRKLAPIFQDTIKRFLEMNKDKIHIVIPSLPHLENHVRTTFHKLNPVIVTDTSDRYAAFTAAHAALAASGTVSLELAMAKTPHIIGYKVGTLTYCIARRLVKTPFVNLINILQQKEIVPECIQARCTPEILSNALQNIWTGKARNKQLNAFADSLQQLGLGKKKLPAERAAEDILKIL